MNYKKTLDFGKIGKMKSIHERPVIVNHRKRIGDYEIDLIIEASHKSSLITINGKGSKENLKTSKNSLKYFSNIM